jgi:hypothetical protein
VIRCGGFAIRNHHCRRVLFTLAVELEDGLLKRCDVSVTACKCGLQVRHLRKGRIKTNAHLRHLLRALRRVVRYGGLVHR